MNSNGERQQDGRRRGLGMAPERPPLSDEAVESIAEWMRVICEPSRIRLMEILNGGPATVGGLAAQLHTTPQNVSRHLGVLHQAGIVRRRKVKNSAEYELVDWSGWWMVEQVGRSLAARLEERQSDLRNCAIA
jgi:DNA-binding transcriptional ArsR family regulator